MANSAVDICNQALILVGADRINTLTDETKAARICNQIFSVMRDQLLTEHPWNFAIKRVALARDATDPVYEFSYRFALPSDCLRVIDSNLGDDQWTIEGRYLATNFSDVKIKYIAKVTDISEWSQGFREALGNKMAIYLAYSLAQSTTLAQALKQDYLTIIRNAKAQDGQEGGVTQIEASEWLNSRF